MTKMIRILASLGFAFAASLAHAEIAGRGECQFVDHGIANLVIDETTYITPSPTWMLETDSFYKPVPVTVALCRIEATLEGNIGIEIWLPVAQSWNRRLLGAGVGGPAGVFNYSDMSRRINEGFATFSTDSGHKADQLRWMADAKALEDYTHRATHLATQVAGALVDVYYGEPADHRYFLGCSGGGRQGLKEMQKYPQDFDGILSGAPGPNMPLQSVRMMWFALQQQARPDAALDDDDWILYERAATEHCDGLDGVVDGVLENPLACEFDTATLACSAAQSRDCLPNEKLEMLDSIVSPMLDENGAAMDWGLVAGVRTRPGPPSPLLRAMWADGVYDDPDWDETNFERTRDLEQAHRHMPEMRADNAAIGDFIQAGGKTIIYQGWADPSTVAGPTIDYYRTLTLANGGIDKLSSSVRLFMVPGMYHCRGGPGADQFGAAGQGSRPGDPERDMLWALIRWTEEGVAPASVIATKEKPTEEQDTRLLCPFPQSAAFRGVARGRDEAAFVCQTDPFLTRLLAEAPEINSSE